ncbi:MAG: OsmC family protein [Dermatophilaceae bacterium]
MRTTGSLAAPGHRQVSLERLAQGRYAVTNVRGGTVVLGRGADSDYTPVELLLAAIAGCTAVDVDEVISRRGEPDSFVVDCSATKVSDELGNHLADVTVTFRIAFADGPEGEAASQVVPRVVRLSHEKLCTVSRTVMLATPVRSVVGDTVVAGGAPDGGPADRQA